jgi:hypothetical protein
MDTDWRSDDNIQAIRNHCFQSGDTRAEGSESLSSALVLFLSTRASIARPIDKLFEEEVTVLDVVAVTKMEIHLNGQN